jgi:hypothetical protein
VVKTMAVIFTPTDDFWDNGPLIPRAFVPGISAVRRG